MVFTIFSKHFKFSFQVIKYAIQNVVYIFEDQSISLPEPENLARTTVKNNGTTSQTISMDLAYRYEESTSWGISRGLEIGVTTTVEAGIPLVINGEVSNCFVVMYNMYDIYLSRFI